MGPSEGIYNKGEKSNSEKGTLFFQVKLQWENGETGLRKICGLCVHFHFRQQMSLGINCRPFSAIRLLSVFWEF